MVELNPPWASTGVAHSSQMARGSLSGLVVGGLGCVSESTALAVSAAGMVLTIQPGTVYVPATWGTSQGVYSCVNDGTKTLTAAAADPVNPRIDLVVARVRDTGAGDASSAWSLELVQGTAAASPVAPTVPGSSYVLAQYTVAAAATSVSSLVDKRGFTVQWGSATRMVFNPNQNIPAGASTRLIGPATIAATSGINAVTPTSTGLTVTNTHPSKSLAVQIQLIVNYTAGVNTATGWIRRVSDAAVSGTTSSAGIGTGATFYTVLAANSSQSFEGWIYQPSGTCTVGASEWNITTQIYG